MRTSSVLASDPLDEYSSLEAFRQPAYMIYVPCAPSSVKSWKCGFARSDCDPQNKADSLGLRWRAGAGIADMLLKSGKTDEPNGPQLGISWLRQAADQGYPQGKGYPQAKEALPK